MLVRNLYFENATIAFEVGKIGDFPAEAICVGTNAEGIMASGHAGIIRLAGGPDVERDLRSQAPLLMGDAYLTGPGKLAESGVRLVVHLVANASPGAPVQRSALERGLDRALELLDQEGVSSLVVPDFGLRIPNIDVDGAAAILATELARRLRRGASLKRVSVVSLDPAYLQALHDRLVALGATKE